MWFAVYTSVCMVHQTLFWVWKWWNYMWIRKVYAWLYFGCMYSVCMTVILCIRKVYVWLYFFLYVYCIYDSSNFLRHSLCHMYLYYATYCTKHIHAIKILHHLNIYICNVILLEQSRHSGYVDCTRYITYIVLVIYPKLVSDDFFLNLDNWIKWNDRWATE